MTSPTGARAREGAECDRGAAVVEFIVVGVAVLVPLMYIMLAAMSVQSAAFASTQAAREAGRAFSSAATPAQGRLRSLAAARLAFADHGLDLPEGALLVTCGSGPCLTPGSVVEVEVSWSVPLPWLPGSVADDVPLHLPIEVIHRVPVDDYRGTPETT